MSVASGSKMFSRSLPVLFLLATACASTPQKKEKPIELTVVPTIHRNHLDPEWNFSLADLAATVSEFRPDLLCIELSADAVASPEEGIFPPEAVFLEEVFRAKGIPVVAADWRAPRETYAGVTLETDEEARKLRRVFLSKVNRQEDRLGYLISHFGKMYTKDLHEMFVRRHGDAAAGFWQERNRRIVETCFQAMQNYKAKRIVFAFGADHLYALEENIRKRQGIVYKYPNPLRTTAALATPASVASRWQKNLQALETLLENPKTAEELRVRIRETHRVQELKEFLAGKILL